MHKKQKLSHESNIDESFGDAIAELDLEISLRKRLADSLESRISWALTLQELLRKDGTGSTTSFRDSAFDALCAIEEPLGIIFAHEAPSRPEHHPKQIVKTPRPLPRQKRTVPRNPNTSFLYIRSSELGPPGNANHVQTYLLRCPGCLRKTFTSLQGLLNHARIVHSIEWGTHDECVRACAVLDPDVDIAAGTEVGLGPNGILPGLRSLFQMAVGTHRPQEIEAEIADEANDGNGVPHDSLPGVHLTQTLGLHQDTPALAPFLGKQAIRRGIKVWDDDATIDVSTTEDLNSKSSWRMPFKNRNDFDPTTANFNDIQMKSPTPDNRDMDCSTAVTTGSGNEYAVKGDTTMQRKDHEGSNVLHTDLTSAVNLPTQGSRFHFASRVIITDRSLWIPLDQRQEPKNHTHKWMLSVESPSYSYHITTILQCLSVTIPSNSGASSQVLTATDPPFFVVGTTDQPFLAKVELTFNGAPRDSGPPVSQVVVLEHWVELDFLKSATVVVGDEQIVDVELDKLTILTPARSHPPIGAKSQWNLNLNQDRPIQDITEHKLEEESKALPTQGYGKALSELLSKFPMTLKDVKGGRPSHPPLPYRLVSTPSQLKDLVHGRRKAIEWGRARALHHAYTLAIQGPEISQADNVPLTIADVFTWLSDEGHFLGPPVNASEPKKVNLNKKRVDKPTNTWCFICGQGTEAHLNLSLVKHETSALRPAGMDTGEDAIRQTRDSVVQSEGVQHYHFPSCNIAPSELQIMKAPMSNIHALLDSCPQPTTYRGDISTKYHKPANLVAASPPDLTLAVRAIVLALKLPTFYPIGNSTSELPLQYSLDQFGTCASQVEGHLAPYAMLSLVVKQFIRVLVEGGLEVAKREKVSGSTVPAVKKKRRAAKEANRFTGILTPVHILSSVFSHKRRDDMDTSEPILECLTRLGISAIRQDETRSPKAEP